MKTFFFKKNLGVKNNHVFFGPFWIFKISILDFFQNTQIKNAIKITSFSDFFNALFWDIVCILTIWAPDSRKIKDLPNLYCVIYASEIMDLDI